MAMVVYCNGCRDRDHSRHEHVVEWVPEGVMGGAVCDCKGECRDLPPEPNPIVEAMVDALSPEAHRLLDDASLWGQSGGSA